MTFIYSTTGLTFEIYRGFELLDLVLSAGVRLANDGDDVHLVVQVFHCLEHKEYGSYQRKNTFMGAHK